jgi:hypothetical protein
MSIVLQGSTSGSVTLQEPAVAGTTVLTLPAVSGTIITTGTTGQVIASGALPIGSVLQVVNATYSTQTTSSSSTYSDTGLTASITPKFATSKVLVFVNLASCGKSTGNTYMSARLLRNSTSILGFDDSAVYTNGGSEESYIGSISTSYLDSPATTSATTYKVQFASGFNVASVKINANLTLNTPFSTITLMEIAA